MLTTIINGVKMKNVIASRGAPVHGIDGNIGSLETRIRNPGDQPTRGAGKILVMDDEEMIRSLAGELLRFLGYRVDSCADGLEAMDLYTSAKNSGEPYDAVLMDLTIMGGMGGKDAIRELRIIDPQIKAILASGSLRDPVMAAPRKYGFSGAVRKPCGARELSEVLHTVIRSDDSSVCALY